MHYVAGDIHNDSVRRMEIRVKDNDYVFLIGIYYPFGELSIMGIYADERDVLDA